MGSPSSSRVLNALGFFGCEGLPTQGAIAAFDAWQHAWQRAASFDLYEAVVILLGWSMSVGLRGCCAFVSAGTPAAINSSITNRTAIYAQFGPSTAKRKKKFDKVS